MECPALFVGESRRKAGMSMMPPKKFAAERNWEMKNGDPSYGGRLRLPSSYRAPQQSDQRPDLALEKHIWKWRN